MFDTLHPLKMTMTPLPSYWVADHDRPRTRNTRPSNAQCTNIFSIKSHTFSLRTSILLLASVIFAPHRKYTTRQIGKKTPVAPLCEWISRRAKHLNWRVSLVLGGGSKAGCHLGLMSTISSSIVFCVEYFGQEPIHI